MQFEALITESPVRVSYRRAVMITILSIIGGQIGTAIAILVTDIRPEVLDEIILTWFVVAAIVSAGLAFPLAIVLQRDRLKLARAMKQLEDVHGELTRRSRIDALTGVLNREAFLRQVNALRVEGTRGAMLMIDVDHFKSINDMYGHLAGDEALRGIAATLAETVRGCDLLGRLGGEEFAAFIPCEDTGTAHDLAERLRLAVARMVFTPQPGVVRRITASIGVATGTPADTLNDLMKRADTSLYEAKKAGRDKVIVHTAA